MQRSRLTLTLVRSALSTAIPPVVASISMPSSAKPMPSTTGTRPMATSSVSPVTVIG